MKGEKFELFDMEYMSEKKNRLLVDPKDKIFCKGCLYLLAVQAIKNTESSLFLGDEETKIPISEDKVINDILPQMNSFTLGQFYPVESGIMEIKVHSGKLKMKVVYRDQ